MTEKQAAYVHGSQSPGKPVKSWNFIMAFSRTGKSWKESSGKKPLVLERSRNLLNSTKNMKCMEGSKEN